MVERCCENIFRLEKQNGKEEEGSKEVIKEEGFKEEEDLTIASHKSPSEEGLLLYSQEGDFCARIPTLMSIFSRIFGDATSRELAAVRPIVGKVNALEEATKALTDEQLRAKTAEFKARLGGGESLDDLLPEAFAAVREAARRTLGQRHYDVQLIGGALLHRGKIAEMRTGEGKTLVATLPAYLNSLTGRGVHVVTVNDYLSRRDGVWMGQVYAALGATVGVLNHEASYLYDPAHLPTGEAGKELDEQRDETGAFRVFHEFLRPSTRREAYQADITYGTNNEYGFDYLRDNLVYRDAQLVQREHVFAIVDEIDSILIDEARTPLIISAPVGDAESLYGRFAGIAGSLQEGEHFTKDEKLKAVQITEAGIDTAERLLGVQNIYTEGGVKYVHHLETALRARVFFERDKEYVVREGEVIIVDEFTGRLQPGRRWSDGLHQAVEAKEGVKIKEESRTFATVSYQNYFRLYEKLSGMTGTAKTSAEEFLKVYKLDVVSVPTNKPAQRSDLDDFIFQTEIGKFAAVAKKIKDLHGKGQPVLVGTISIEKNEQLSELLKREGVPHEVLNAKNHEREGEIIAQAGRIGGVTIATNMAGRGVDIVLGGNPVNKEMQEKVRGLGGLFVIGTERHEARRIDNQLRGRAGRQGDPGTTQFFVSLEDSLMRIFASDSIKKMMGSFGIPENEPIQNRFVTRALESAQTKIEGLNFDARKHLLEYDNVMNHQRTVVYGRRRAILLGDQAYLDTMLASIASMQPNKEELEVLFAKEKEKLGADAFYDRVKVLALQIIDMLWVDHLETMDYLRSSVRLRAYGQRDPLIEYKREGLRIFKDFEATFEANLVRMLPSVEQGAVRLEEQKLEEVKESAQLIGSGDQEEKVHHARAGHKEPGRNEPCPCGSGRKYKNCGLPNTEEHQRLMGNK